MSNKMLKSLEIGGAEFFPIPVQTGFGENSIQSTSATAAGSMAFSITGISPGEEYYFLDSVEGLEVGMRVSIQLTKNYDDCGEIIEVGNNYVKLSTFCYTEGEDVVQENSSLRVLDHPELGTFRFGTAATAFGYETKAGGIGALAAGYATEAHGKYSTAFGNTTKAGYAATALGRDTNANGRMSLAIGDATTALGQCSVAGGYNSTASNDGALAIGHTSTANGYYGTSRGLETKANGEYSTALGVRTEAGDRAVATGTDTKALGKESTAKGNLSKASGAQSFASGYDANAESALAFAHGDKVKALGTVSIALGAKTTAKGNFALAAPYSSNLASDVTDLNLSKEELLNAWRNSPAYNRFNLAKGNFSLALGRDCAALGDGSVALGYENVVKEWGSVAAGHNLISTGATQTVVGKFNNPDASHVFQVGGGTSDTNRKNVFWVKADGTTSLDEKIADITIDEIDAICIIRDKNSGYDLDGDGVISEYSVYIEAAESMTNESTTVKEGAPYYNVVRLPYGVGSTNIGNYIRHIEDDVYEINIPCVTEDIQARV